MPTYDYRCDACEHSFDELQSITEKPLTTCPKCHKKKLRRLFGTGAAVLFKGSGFYETDYRSESYKAGEKAEKEKTSDGGTASKESAGKSSGGDAAPKESAAKDAPATGTTGTDSRNKATANGKPREKTSKSSGS